MVGLFYIYLPMSWQIPTQIEQDIIAGKAKYQTFQTGNGGQSILQVPPNSYAVIFGYDFSPAGGGFAVASSNINTGASQVTRATDEIRFFETQQISFYTGNDFYPFIHHVNSEITSFISRFDILTGETVTLKTLSTIDNTPISRQVYITSTNDVSITVGLIDSTPMVSQNAIPITNRTPQALTYGGSVQAINTQTDYGALATPLNFMQPSTKDYADFAFGLLPNNPDNQAFATPDFPNGLVDPTYFLQNVIGTGTLAKAAANYYLCLHYALYSKTIPEQRG
jgi:hypothetical protein